MNPFAKFVTLTTARTLLAVFVGGLCLSAQNPAAQTPSPAPPKAARHDSVEVVAHLSPEEVEEGKLNDLYESVAQVSRKGVCTADVVERYESEVIPKAEQATFNVPKNKFLFLANREIGNCYMALGKYAEAEERFKKIMEYLPIWPGTGDSDYPINFRQIATAEMAQQHWEAAEDSLNKSVSLFDPQIQKALKSDNEFSRVEHAGNLLGLKARSLAYLGLVYLREGRTADALKTAELAYNDAARPHVPSVFYNEVVKVGRSIAQASGDKAADARWLERSLR